MILALAAPILNPRESALSGNGPVVVMLDNGWASARDWDERRAAAEDLIREAGEDGRPVSLVLTADDAANDTAPVEAATALERLAAAEPRPIAPDRAAAATRLAAVLGGTGGASLAYLSDGLDGGGIQAATQTLRGLNPGQTILYAPPVGTLTGLTGAENASDALVVRAVRPEGEAGPATYQLRALDAQEREIARAPIVFAAGSSAAEARFQIPVELRNDVARVEREGLHDAASVRLVDESFQRRRVALVSGEAADLAQPLLSPLYYITRALEPFADLVRAGSADLGTAIPALVEQRPSVIVLADIGVLPEAATQALDAFLENGGTLVRFAGPRLAASTAEDTLVPVRLRGGERQLGGALSWSEPQKLAPIADGSPFAGIAVPDDVTVSRQILAEPSAELSERTWASLADGTPIVTAAQRGAGTIVLFHTTAEATWSNLPISGAFVDMLRRIVSLSRGAVGTDGGTAETSLPPYRVMEGDARLVQPGPEIRPLVFVPGTPPVPSLQNPPGLYGTAEGYRALNLLAADATLRPLPALDLGVPASLRGYGTAGSTDLTPWLFAGAVALFALDALALLWLHGGFSRLRRGFARRAAPAMLALGLGMAGLGAPSTAPTRRIARRRPRWRRRGWKGSMPPRRSNRPRRRISPMSRPGMPERTRSRARVSTACRSSSPRRRRWSPAGDGRRHRHRRAFLLPDPLLADPCLSAHAEPGGDQPGRCLHEARRHGALRRGGRRDGRPVGRRGLGRAAAAARHPGRSRHPASGAGAGRPRADQGLLHHGQLPGRHTGSDLWVESLVRSADAEARPASAGDGVSSIMITSNDFASAWAVDDNGLFVFPTDNADPSQREYAYRAGVNIVMYVLTGNYKADQVHVPALLERLGQ